MILILVSVLLEIIFALLHLVVICGIIFKIIKARTVKYFGLTKAKTKLIEPIIDEHIAEILVISCVGCICVSFVSILFAIYSLVATNDAGVLHSISDLIHVYTVVHITIEIVFVFASLVFAYIVGDFNKMYKAIKDKLNEQELIDIKRKIKVD